MSTVEDADVVALVATALRQHRGEAAPALTALVSSAVALGTWIELHLGTPEDTAIERGILRAAGRAKIREGTSPIELAGAARDVVQSAASHAGDPADVSPGLALALHRVEPGEPVVLALLALAATCAHRWGITFEQVGVMLRGAMAAQPRTTTPEERS